MADTVKENSVNIRKIGEYIDDEASKFMTIISEELYGTLRREIGLDSSHLAWYGEGAEKYIKNLDTKENSFIDAGRNIQKLGQNLVEQAIAWNNFEKRQ